MRYGRSLLAVLLAVFLAACQTLTGSTAGENIDDARITLAIKTKLAEGKAATLTRIGVKTVQGTVYLTGVVETGELKQRAADMLAVPVANIAQAYLAEWLEPLRSALDEVNRLAEVDQVPDA